MGGSTIESLRPLRRGAAAFLVGFGLMVGASAPVFATSDILAAQSAFIDAYARIDPGANGPKQSDYMADLINRKGGSRVPVLMPFAMTDCEESATYHRLALRLSETNYTGVLHQPGLDIVISGETPIYASAARTNYNHGFRGFDDKRGGTISFGWGGADYEVEFHCRGLDEPGHGNCISPEKAESFVRDMLAGK